MKKKLYNFFDQLNPSFSKYFKREELVNLLKETGFKDINIKHRHGYSWLAIAKKVVINYENLLDYFFIFTLSFCVRLFFILSFPETGGDFDIYSTVAKNILRGCGVSLSDPLSYSMCCAFWRKSWSWL